MIHWHKVAREKSNPNLPSPYWFLPHCSWVSADQDYQSDETEDFNL